MASGATYFIKFQSEGAAAVANGGGSPAVPGDMPAEIQAGLKNVQREIQNRVPPLTGFFKQMGIEVSLKSMLKQSQIFTSYVGSLFQIFGAMVDVMLAPLMPILIPAMQWLASKVPVVADWAQKKIDRLVEILTPLWNWLRTVFAGGWESGMEILSQKMQGWMDDHGLGFAKGLVAGITEWMGDHPGWSTIGGIIALAMMRKLSFKIAPLAIGLGWGALKWAASPGLGKAASATADAAGDVGKSGRVGKVVTSIADTGRKVASWGGLSQKAIMGGKIPAGLANLTKQARDYSLGFREIEGKRVNIYTKAGAGALAKLGRAGQVFAIMGGAYKIGKEWLADQHERKLIADAIQAAGVPEGRVDMVDSLQAMKFLRYAEGATDIAFGKSRSPMMMMALLPAMIGLGGAYAGMQDELNRQFQLLTPEKLNDPNYMQNWAGKFMNQMQSFAGTEVGIEGINKESGIWDMAWRMAFGGTGDLGVASMANIWKYVGSGQKPWVPGGEVTPGNVTFTVQFGGPMGHGPEQYYQMSWAESFNHYTELIAAGHRVEVDASNVLR